MNDIYDNERLQERQDTPLVLPTSGTANLDIDSQEDIKPDCHERSGDTDKIRSFVDNKHTVFVLNYEGKPLTPTTPARARKLLRDGMAKKVWSKFNTFGIQLIERTREEIPKTTLGYDPGTKFEGFSIVCGHENNLSVKLDLPDKRHIVRKIEERRQLRRHRRDRKCRRREARFQNRGKKGFVPPSQMVLVNSRLKILRELCHVYPVQSAAIEDCRFNHYKYRWGKNFSAMEYGKHKIEDFFESNNIGVIKFMGFETAEIRKKFGYKKASLKNANKFSAHCSDSLSLATEINCREQISEGTFLVVDDTYRCVRRKLHYIQPSKGGVRKKCSQGNVNGIRKGTMMGTKKGNIGQLCGNDDGFFRYYGMDGIRKTARKLLWFNNQFKIKYREDAHSLI